MGSVKALVRFAGRPLAAHAASALREAGAAEVLAIGIPDGPTRASLAALGLTLVDDTVAQGGPVAGVLRALEVAAHDVVVVLACDTPFVDAATVGALVRALVAGPAHMASVAVSPAPGGSRREPLIAAYRRAARPAFQEALAAGGAMQRVLDALAPVQVPIDARIAVNLNTVEDVRATGGGDA